MNEYIFNWIENSEKILQTGEYSTFHSRFREQVALIRYLLDMGKTKQEIYTIWQKTNPYEIRYADDEEEKKEVFTRAWRKAQRWVNRFHPPITIYQEEINFINNMSVSLWIKQYILTMLAVYKYYRDTWCCYTNRLKCFCYSQTSVQYEREKFTRQMHDCITKYNPYTMMIYDNQVAFKMNFAQALGTRLATISDPSRVADLFGYLKDTRICPCCGKTYEVNCFVRRKMCEECYKKERNRKKNAYKKR